MRPISKQTKEQLANDPFMKVCCLSGKTAMMCTGTIEWHHNLIFTGKQSDEPETILPLCKGHHYAADIKDIKELLDLIMLKRMSDKQIDIFSKAINYRQRLKYLKQKYD